MKCCKRWLMLLASLMFVFSMAACGPDRNTEALEQGADRSAQDEKPDQLIVWANDDAGQLKAVEAIAQKYTEQTGIEVEIVPVSGAEQVQKLALAAPSGEGPDLFYQPQDRLGDIVVQGLAEPIAMEDEAAKGYNSAAMEAVRYEGETYGYPISIETYAVYYNQDLVPEAPASMEAVIELSHRLTDAKNDRYAFLMVPDFYYAIPFIMNYGGYIFGGEPGNYDVEDIGLNHDGAVQGLEVYQQFVQSVRIPETLTIDVMDSLFMEGKVGMAVNGMWAMKTYEEKLGDKLATAPLPAVGGKASPSFVGVKSWFVSSYSEHPDWAMDLAAFLTSDENALLYHETTGEIPARTAVQKQIDDPFYQGFIEQIESGIQMPNVPEMTPVWEMDKAMDFILQGEDVRAVLDETVGTIQQQIAAFGK
ncbi:extracellular solute-binding protein [Marinicrinis lubricantis]|uniref:Maltodextrin-binding protein n=1 Tax=Marinicrinis lubricantis TaxID=2086470 RepID=A0ABW1INY9_9BACL